MELESWRPNFGLVYDLRSPTRSGDALFQNRSYHWLVLRTLAPDSCDSSRVVDFLGADDKPSVFELVLETDSKFYSHSPFHQRAKRDSTRQRKAGLRNFLSARFGSMKHANCYATDSLSCLKLYRYRKQEPLILCPIGPIGSFRNGRTKNHRYSVHGRL